MLDDSFLNLNSSVSESSVSVFKIKWMLGQNLCECVKDCELGKSKWALV